METLRRAFARTTWENKNTAIICYAAFCANFETAVAWGLMSVWARDQLGLSGAERDFFTGCYSFMKGFTQIVSGVASDKIGRAGPIAFGLIGGAVSLLIACFGAGFDGKFLLAADASADEKQAMQLAYLTLSSVALGFCTGVAYPVLAAAAVDHAPDETHYAATLGVVRFWRDLGYVMGVPIAAIADSSSTEIAFILVALIMTSAGVGVYKTYAENMSTTMVAASSAARAGYDLAPTSDYADEPRLMEMAPIGHAPQIYVAT
jgi:MFS family permease